MKNVVPDWLCHDDVLRWESPMSSGHVCERNVCCALYLEDGVIPSHIDNVEGLIFDRFPGWELIPRSEYGADCIVVTGFGMRWWMRRK